MMARRPIALVPGEEIEAQIRRAAPAPRAPRRPRGEIEVLRERVRQLEAEVAGQRILIELDRAEAERLAPLVRDGLRYRAERREALERDKLRKQGVKLPPKRKPSWSDADEENFARYGAPYEQHLAAQRHAAGGDWEAARVDRAAACGAVIDAAGETLDAAGRDRVRAILRRLHKKGGIYEEPPPSWGRRR